jgi:uncharacterized membrane protein YeiB
MIVSRRPWFFLLVAIVCLLLYEPTPADFRWVNVAMALLSFFWFVLLGVEEILGQRKSGPRSQGDER